MNPNLVCSEDGNRIAVCSCFCRFPLPTICEDCLVKHPTDTDYPMHFYLPLNAGQLIDSKVVRDKYRLWLYKLHNAYTTLKRNDEEMASFEEHLEAARQESLIQFSDELNTYCSEARTRLTALRYDFNPKLQNAFREVCWHSTEQWEPETNSLAALLWNYDGVSSLGLFHGWAGKTENQISSTFQISMEMALPEFTQFNYRTEESALKTELQALRTELEEGKTRSEVLEREKTEQTKKYDDLQASYLQLCEDLKGYMKCTKCAKVYALQSFLQYDYCGCKICIYCQVELMKVNNGMCLCGNAFHSSSLNAVNERKDVCGSCKLYLPLMTKFTPVRCSEHILCVKCLEKACNESEPRCPCDYRVFTPDEIEMAKKFFVRQCDLHCGHFFDSSGALDLPCGCHYCQCCAAQDIMAGKPIQNCFTCRKPFPAAIIDKWIEILKEEEKKLCAICMIEQSHLFVLKNCGHYFHKDCIANFGANFITTVVTKEMTCPMHSCGKPIDLNDLQRAMAPEDFDKYCAKLMIQCPNCRLMNLNEETELSLFREIVCLHCGYNFCGTCKKKWVDQHGERCKFENLKALIQMVEMALGQGAGNKIAQCPACKTPYLKDEHCDHVKCLRCPLDWCFKCSCYRHPFLEHNEMWHRPQCPHYAVVPNDNEPMKPKCPRCIKKGSRCNPPKDLKVPCRFDFDEYNIDD